MARPAPSTPVPLGWRRAYNGRFCTAASQDAALDAMEAERLNALAALIADLGRRVIELRGYL
jgi:hypothetical protein